MSKPNAEKFIFGSYRLDPERKRAVFSYSIEFTDRESLDFEETLVFPEAIDIASIPETLLKNVLRSTHLMLGISYFKLYCPSEIVLSSDPISEKQAEFWNVIYGRGLGEFYYRNGLDPNGTIRFPYEADEVSRPVVMSRKDRALVGIGGGKDSIVAGELLKGNGYGFSTFLVETQKSSPISESVAKEMGVPSVTVRRLLDGKLFESHEGAYQGHIPVSAVFAFIGYLTAVLYDYSYVVVGNEKSSDFGNVRVGDTDVNHQWSKSSEFERLFREYTGNFLSPDITYFSLLRLFHEIRIAELFSEYPEYFRLFSSCNRTVRIHRERPETKWCGECPKCVFAFTILSPFIPKKALVPIFGRNLYDDERLLPSFADILGFGGMKPFDCVGTFEESQSALYLARESYAGSAVMRAYLGRIADPERLVGEVFGTSPAPMVPARFALLGMRNVLILGYGKEGKTTERYLRELFPDLGIDIADKVTDPAYLERQKEYDFAIKTPGIPKRLVSIPYTTATNIFFSQVRNIVVGVTGSKGKSTTASLIHAILKEAGLKTRLLGNIGTPMLGIMLGPVDPDEILVVELSSYQLDDISYSPDIAVVLNLFPEHMDYHDGVGRYYEAKRNILKYQVPGGSFVYNGNDETLRLWESVEGVARISFSGTDDAQEDIETRLKGNHNRDNIAAALAVAGIFGIPEDVSKRAIAAFEPLPHRLQNIGSYRSITFYDDAISTTPESTMMALQAIPDVDTILLGGEDRGYDFTRLEDALREKGARNVVLFPDSGPRILRTRDGFNVLETSSMEEAVAFAYAHTKRGGVCLLSAASPSYSLWKNFEEKGDQYRECVERLAT